MIHFYGLPQTAVMEMPIRRFWLFSSNVDRIMAQGDLRALMVTASAASPEGGRACQSRLVIELGEIQVLEKTAPIYEERDQSAFDELKSMM